MPQLGETLRSARQEAGLSLSQVEQATRIRHYHIEALEKEDFESLPGLVYAKGYLRSLAEFYRLDPGELTQLLDQSRPPATQTTVVPVVRYASSPSPITTTTILMVILLLVLAGLGFYSYQQISTLARDEARNPSQLASSVRVSSTAVAAPTAELKGEAPPPTPVPTPTPSPTATPVTVILVEARIVDRAWIQVTVDDQQIFQGILVPGDRREWTGKNKVVLRSGNAGGVEITFNGKKQGVMGSRGEVLEKEWSIPLAGANQN